MTIRRIVSSNCPTPLIERTHPQIPIMFSSNQVPTQTEEIRDRSMSIKEPLSLLGRFEPPHPSLPDTGSLMRLLGPIVFVLAGAVDRLWNKLPVGNAIAA